MDETTVTPKPLLLKTKFWMTALALLAGLLGLFFPPENIEKLFNLFGAIAIALLYVIKEIRNDIHSLESPEIRAPWYRRGTLWTAAGVIIVLIIHYFVGDTKTLKQILSIITLVGSAGTYFIVDGQLDLSVFRSYEATIDFIDDLKDEGEDEEESEDESEDEEESEEETEGIF